MATKRYRKSNKNSKITYEDIKDLDFNSLSDEELEKYGLGSWLKKNANWLAPVAAGVATIATGGMAAPLLAPAMMAGSAVGGAVTNNYNQDQAIAAQNAQNKQTNAYTQAQNQLQMLQGNTPQETMGVVRRCGGKLRRMAKGGPVKHYLTTSSGEREISPEELAEVQRYLGIQQKINNYYTGKYKSSIDKFTKLGINTPQAYADYIAKNPKEALAAEDYNSLYKGAGLSKEEIDFYDPLRNKYFTPGEVQGSLEGMKDRVTDTAFGGRNLFAGLKLGLKEMPMKIETPANPYSYEPFRGYPNIQIGYTMDKTGGARTPSVFRNAAGQEVAIDPKKGLIPTEYPELTQDFQYTQPKKPLSQMRFRHGGTINYNGQYHEGPNGGVPVDEMGNPNYYNPVALVEKGEVSYTGKDGEPYIFSDTLNLSKKNTFANEAKRTQGKYKLRMKGGKINDPIAKKGYDLDMENLKSKQEELRDAMELMEEDKMARNRKYGGNLPEYDGLSTDSMYLPSNDYGITGSKYYSTPTNRFEIPSGPVVNSTAQMQKDLGITSTGNIRLSEDKQRLGTEWTPYSGAGYESALGLIAPVAGNIINMVGANRRRGKGRISVPESGPSPTPISLERERASARELGNVASANTRRALKGGTSAQQYMANVGAAEADIQRNLGNQLGESYQREELMNSNLSQEERVRQDRLKEMGMQADMYNSQLGMMEDAQRSQYINNIINAVNQWGADMSKSKQNAMFMQMLNPNIRIQQRPRYRSWMGRNFGPKDTRVWEDLND